MYMYASDVLTCKPSYTHTYMSMYIHIGKYIFISSKFMLSASFLLYTLQGKCNKHTFLCIFTYTWHSHTGDNLHTTSNNEVIECLV